MKAGKFHHVFTPLEMMKDEWIFFGQEVGEESSPTIIPRLKVKIL